MRMTTLLKKLLGIQHLLVTGFTIEDGALVIEVRPSWRTPRCSGCTKPRGRDDTLPPRRWRHLDFGGVRVYLRWPLLKNPWNLTRKQTQRLSTLQRDNDRLYRAYLLKETFADILDRRQPIVVNAKLKEWLSWASRSRLPGFVKVARTIRAHLDDIVAYIRWGVTNGIVEGLHNKVRVITRRAFGFHSASALIGMIMLCCTNLELHPPRVSLAK